jgi:hypothetical protein
VLGAEGEGGGRGVIMDCLGSYLLGSSMLTSSCFAGSSSVARDRWDDLVPSEGGMRYPFSVHRW